MSIAGINWYVYMRTNTFSRMFCFSRRGVQGATFLPLEIVFDSKTKRLHPKSLEKPKWISVCGRDDKDCMKCKF